VDDVTKDVTDGWNFDSNRPFFTSSSEKLPTNVNKYYQFFLKYCEDMVDADSDDAKELSLGASLWNNLDSNMNADNAEAMAQALARLLADPTVNVAGKYSSCSS